MCGVWAKMKRTGEVSRAELVRPVQMLAHRGPDGYGWFLENSTALVHTRLSIIDLEGGKQPLYTEDGSVVGIVNGELYDHQAIRDELENSGVRFATRSDSEVLLQLFAKRGAAGLRGLKAEFAFIFHDRRAKRLYFARDQHGVKPLYMKLDAEQISLASEIKALLDGPAEFDQEYLLRYFARVLTPPRTAIAGVEHVLPGRLYCFDQTTWQLSWQPLDPLPLFAKRDLRGEDAVEKFESELTAAVKRRLIADVEIGAYLSGGIDSAMIAAVAAANGARLKTFTVGFDDERFDESAQAHAIADKLGLEHFDIRLSNRNFFESLLHSIRAFEGPISNPHGAAKNLLSSLASRHVKVVLTGEGADEWLGGYAYQRIAKLRRFEETHPRFANGAMQAFLGKEGGANLNHLAGLNVDPELAGAGSFFGYSPSLLGRLPRRRLYRYLTDTDLLPVGHRALDDLRTYLVEETGLNAATFADTSVSRNDVDVWMALRTDLLSYILANVGDRQEMAHSLEGRTPFLDLNVISVAAQLHPHELISGLQEKALLRRVGRRYLPIEMTRQRKKPFFSPLKYFFAGRFQPEIENYLLSARDAAPWLPWSRLQRALTAGARGPKRPSDRLLAYLRLTLFSVGVLREHLHQPLLTTARGYRIPKTADDMTESQSHQTNSFHMVKKANLYAVTK